MAFYIFLRCYTGNGNLYWNKRIRIMELVLIISIIVFMFGMFIRDIENSMK